VFARKLRVAAFSYVGSDPVLLRLALGYQSGDLRQRTISATRRLRRRARLDAMFFHLYGFDREAAEYVIGTFPIVRREDEQRYAGLFRSRDLILGYRLYGNTRCRLPGCRRCRLIRLSLRSQNVQNHQGESGRVSLAGQRRRLVVTGDRLRRPAMAAVEGWPLRRIRARRAVRWRRA